MTWGKLTAPRLPPQGTYGRSHTSTHVTTFMMPVRVHADWNLKSFTNPRSSTVTSKDLDPFTAQALMSVPSLPVGHMPDVQIEHMIG